jgi:hypothetical protein
MDISAICSIYKEEATPQKEEKRVVSAWWLLGAFFLGGYAGILLMALMTMVRAADSDADGARNSALHPLTSGHHTQSAIDPVI